MTAAVTLAEAAASAREMGAHMLEALALADLCALGADAAAATRLAALLALGVEVPAAAAGWASPVPTEAKVSAGGI